MFFGWGGGNVYPFSFVGACFGSKVATLSIFFLDFTAKGRTTCLLSAFLRSAATSILLLFNRQHQKLYLYSNYLYRVD